MTELDEIRRRLEAAENANDAQAFVDVMTDDIVVMVPDYPVQEGKAAEVTEGGGLGFDRGTFAFTVSGKDAGAERSIVRGKYFYVYRRDGGAWKLWRVIMSTDEDEEKVEETT